MASRRSQQWRSGFEERAPITPEEAGRVLYGDQNAAWAVALEDLVFDPTIQVRVEGTNREHLAMLTQVLLNGGAFRDPIIVFRDEDGRLLVADGWHRAEATREALKQTDEVAPLLAQELPGGRVAALEYAETANLRHGLKLSLKSKRAMFERRLKRGHAWATLSNRLIAAELGVDEGTIRHWRSSHNAEISALAEATGGIQSSENIRVTSDGRHWNVDKQQRRAERKAEREQPKTPAVPSFIPDDFDQTPPDDEPFQAVTAVEQPTMTLPAPTGEHMAQPAGVYNTPIMQRTIKQTSISQARTTAASLRRIGELVAAEEWEQVAQFWAEKWGFA